MKILLSHRYFWPDTPPYGSMLRTIAEALAAEGHEVTVFAGQPSYRSNGARRQPRRETVGRVSVRRIPMLPERGRSIGVRLLNNAWYVLSLFLHVLVRGNYDVVTAATFPPVFAAHAAALAAHLTGASFVYHCQDLHPEVSRISRLLRDGSIFRALRHLDHRTCDAAARVVVLSEDMRGTLEARPGFDVSRVVVINNFLPETFGDVEGSTPSVRLPGSGFHVVFTGNLGRFQGLEAVVEAAYLLADENEIHFTFVGEGVTKEELERRAAPLRDRTVHFLPHQSQAGAERLVAAADLALVSLCREIHSVAYPSKTLTYLAVGTPLLAAVEPHSELGRMVVEERVGWAVEPEDPAALADAVRDAFARRAELPAFRERARCLYARRFSVQRAVGQWQRLVGELRSR